MRLWLPFRLISLGGLVITQSIMERQELDSNGDGKIDIWVHLIEGMYMKSYEQDVNFDGEIDIVKEYGN